MVTQHCFVFSRIYGDEVKVYLFGSRLDDNKRGGDIDLLVRTESGKKGGHVFACFPV